MVSLLLVQHTLPNSQVAKADFKAEPSVGWYCFLLTWFCTLRHHINKICLVNWLNPCAFCKLQDDVQDGRQPRDSQLWTSFCNPLTDFDDLWVFFYIYSYVLDAMEIHISFMKHFLRHSTMPIFMKMTKDTINKLKQPCLPCKSICVTNKIWQGNLNQICVFFQIQDGR